MFTNLYEKIINKEEKISLVGLGYVGMPIAVAFAKKVDVIGYDLNEKRLNFIRAASTRHLKSVTKQSRKQQLNSPLMNQSSERQYSTSLPFPHP